MPAQHRPLIAAHRGAWGPEPRNSLKAFEKAVALGADMIELDVRSTADGHLAVVHDPEIGGIPVRNLDWADLSRLAPDAPLFETVVRAVGGRIALNVELKEPGLEERVLALFRRTPPKKVFILSSFMPDVLAACRRLDPTAPLGLILERKVTEGIRLCISRGWPWIMLHDGLATESALTRCARDGLATMVWTVNDPGRMRDLLSHDKVAGIFTDRPELALALRRDLFAGG